MTPTDNELIVGCRAGNGRSWEQVMAKYERLVYSIPLNYGLSHADAADITQITFTIMLQSINKLRDDSRLGAWLATVAKRHTWRLVERQRRESVNATEDLSQSERLAAESDDSQSMEVEEKIEWLERGFDLLDERCADLLHALYFDKEKPAYADIAPMLGIKLGSIGPTRARCLKRLKKLLGNPDIHH